jgi:hypothetical protein
MMNPQAIINIANECLVLIEAIKKEAGKDIPQKAYLLEKDEDLICCAKRLKAYTDFK